MKKLDKSKLIDKIGQEGIYLTVAEAVASCNSMLKSCKSSPVAMDCDTQDNNV